MANKNNDPKMGGRNNFFKNVLDDKKVEKATGRTARPAAPEADKPQVSPALPADTQEETSPRNERASFMTKSGRVRTTVTLWPETLASLEQLKAQSRRSGRKETLGDVLEAAVQALIKERNTRL